MVTRDDLQALCERLSQQKVLSLDTETTGLELWKLDKPFAIVIADEISEYYFNLNPHAGDYPTLTVEDLKYLQPILDNESLVLRMANAKFDLAALKKVGLTVKCQVRDVLVQAKLVDNTHMKYSLDECAKREGMAKSDEVKAYALEHKLFERYTVPGKKQSSKRFFYHFVPIDIMERYARLDARITYDLGAIYDKRLSEMAEATPPNLCSPETVALNEYVFTKTCFDMEEVGIQIDTGQAYRGIQEQDAIISKNLQIYKRLAQQDLVDSNKALHALFSVLGEKGGTTENGNPSYDNAVLSKIKVGTAGIIAQAVLDYRDANKKKNTYYQNFLYWADKEGVVHCNMRQDGAVTGRMSIKDPALQTIPKEEDGSEEAAKVKKCFVPRKDYCFVEFDYKAFEYRMMLEYAKELDLAQHVNDGMDVHLATAQMIGSDRKTAKTINFACLYGAGSQKIADSLKIPLSQAKEFKQMYFSKLPKVHKFLYDVQDKAKKRGFIFNWLGRRLMFPDPNFAYKAPNALIQGGCADVVKFAMNRCHQYLQGMKSRLILQVHDSVLFEVHKDELDIIDDLKTLLENTYPSKLMKFEVDCKISWKSWGEMEDYGKKA